MGILVQTLSLHHCVILALFLSGPFIPQQVSSVYYTLQNHQYRIKLLLTSSTSVNDKLKGIVIEPFSFIYELYLLADSCPVHQWFHPTVKQILFRAPLPLQKKSLQFHVAQILRDTQQCHLMKEFCQQLVVSSPYVTFIIKSANSFKSPLAIV